MQKHKGIVKSCSIIREGTTNGKDWKLYEVFFENNLLKFTGLENLTVGEEVEREYEIKPWKDKKGIIHEDYRLKPDNSSAPKQQGDQMWNYLENLKNLLENLQTKIEEIEIKIDDIYYNTTNKPKTTDYLPPVDMGGDQIPF